MTRKEWVAVGLIIAALAIWAFDAVVFFSSI